MTSRARRSSAREARETSRDARAVRSSRASRFLRLFDDVRARVLCGTSQLFAFVYDYAKSMLHEKNE